MADPPPPPIQPLAPGNYDRAWNDPPLFSYNPGTAQPGGGSRLTRRVGFPSTSTSAPLPSGTDPTAPPSLHDAGARPPPSLIPPPPSLMTMPPASTPTAPQSSLNTDSVAFDHSMNPLNADDLEATLKRLTGNHFDSVKAKEVGKRLDGLVVAYRADALVTRIPILLAKLLTSLENGDTTGAEASFTTLSADHGGEPGNAQWMVALRHLVSKVSEESKGKEEEVITTPLLLPTNN